MAPTSQNQKVKSQSPEPTHILQRPPSQPQELASDGTQQNLTDQALLVNSLSARTLVTAQFENLTETVLGSRDTDPIKKDALKELTVIGKSYTWKILPDFN